MTVSGLLVVAQLLAAASPKVASYVGSSNLPTAPRVSEALANENRVPAGRLVNGVLVLALEAREVAWHPDGKLGGVLYMYAFAEAGHAGVIPGPFIRVPAGTEIHATMRNTLPRPMRLGGLQDHASAALDTIDIAPGATREIRFRANVPGTYFYFGRAAETIPDRAGSTKDAELVGAFIVDPAGARPPSSERIFVITVFADTVGALGVPHPRMDSVFRRFGGPPAMWRTFDMNGRAWPHTERLTYEVGDTVRWRVINASRLAHPMHLHGFYFDVLSRGDASRDTVYSESQTRKAVTEPMLPWTTMTMKWVPTRAGNWLFHCHLTDHIDIALRLSANPYLADAHANHAESGMVGLVMGITVVSRPGAVAAATPIARRKLRLFVNERARVYRDQPGYSFVLQEGPAEPARDSVRVPSSTLVLHRNEPTEITVINRMKEVATVHWHGIEVESFYDGVGDWSGSGSHIAPPIAPGDSFVVRFTPDRAGTFIYHTHSAETNQISSGLYGPLLVLPENAVRDTTDRVFLLGEGGPQDDAPPFVNGLASPPPVELRAGVAHRFRFVSIGASGRKLVRLLAGSTVQQWRAVAKDGADLPPQQATTRVGIVDLRPGETWDFEVKRDRPEQLMLEVTTIAGLRQSVTRVPVIVR